MSVLSIQLLGTFHVRFDGQTVSGFRTERERALLSYLAVETDRPHRRDAIVGLLWPESTEDQARNNLRVTLHRLRKTLEDATGEPDVLLVSRDALRLNPDFPISLDLTDFLSAVSDAEAIRKAQSAADPLRLQRLETAARMYRGEFLKGFSFDESDAYSIWAISTRERLHRQVLQVLHELAEMRQRRGELRRALHYARRQLELEPWREEAHRQVMGILARSGERSAALAQFQVCRQALAEELGVEPAEETVRLYELIQAFERRRLLNFPEQATAFVGREAELDRIGAALANPACRLLTLTGPGGIGKTRLALEVSKIQSPAFLDGVAFVSLSEVGEPDLLPGALARALAIPLAERKDLRQQILDYLREKEMLLVLDNLEHLVEDAGVVVDILNHAPQVKILATSRERLSVRQEWPFELEGLEWPQNEQEVAGSYSAVQLFKQSARRHQPDFALADREAVVRICRLLAGMPLAIELAAAQVRDYSLEEIANELQQSLDLLATSTRDASPRHRSLRAAIIHSWNLLTGEEQQVLARVSVFIGGFDSHAAAFVTGASRSTLASLADKSLLKRIVALGGSASVRYDLHPLVRQFAAEMLEQRETDESDSGREETERLHGMYYMGYLGQRAQSMRGPEQDQALDEILPEIENTRVAWRWAIDNGRVEEIGNALLVLLHLYEIEALFEEAEQTFALAAAKLGQMAKETGPANQAVERVLSWAMAYQGWYAMRLGRYEQAVALNKQSMAIADHIGDLQLKANCLDGLGIVALLHGDYALARQHFQISYHLFQSVNDDWFAASMLLNLGRVAFFQGKYDEARDLIEQALNEQRRLGDKWAIASSLHQLGIIAARTGDYQLAQAWLEEALVLRKAIGHRWGIADGLNGLADIALQRGAYAEAKESYEQSLALARESGARDRMAEVLSALGEINLSLGDHQAARRRFQESLEIATAIQARPVLLRARLGLGTLSAQEGQHWEAAVYVAGVQGDPAAPPQVSEAAERLMNELATFLDDDELIHAIALQEDP